MIGQKLEEERLLVGKNSCTNKTEEDFNELDNDDDWAKIGGREPIGRPRTGVRIKRMETLR